MFYYPKKDPIFDVLDGKYSFNNFVSFKKKNGEMNAIKLTLINKKS